ncbi:redoxin domain-containing protein [Aquincola sp. S2]|uniref:Redoxin domain-containing protein n=1 Tax=Pseudaquabacterium terrae TaxID=2732868 RepID=A0ABX2EPZ7_9BURK|nr:redoxin domain-containing protein [Aquabacterium terrae]NRF70722.1 redoxin domain-containing protein [Aquabacterium terrae]
MDRPVPSALQLHVSRWFNTPKPIALDELRGKVVAVHTFQMLCPACVAHGLPQAMRLREAFSADQLAVIGLHTVFEHHPVMGPDALQAFIHEYQLRFPIGVDEADPHGTVPRTMAAWGLRGTPSLVLLDRYGQARLSHFGRIDDLTLGAVVGQLLERPYQPEVMADEHVRDGRCDGDACHP